MEEFEKIKWSWHTARTSKEYDAYFDINMSDRRSFHPADPLRCQLLEIHPVNLDESMNDDSTSVASRKSSAIPKDPRTGREAPNLVCDFSVTNVPLQNSLLSDVSHFTMKEHRQCINAIEKLHATDLSVADMENLAFYRAVADLRREEKSVYLNRVLKHFERHLSQRCTKVNPVLKDFVMANWKLSVVDVMRRFATNWYRLQAGVPLTKTGPGAVQVDAKSVHAEEDGYVLKSVCHNTQRYMYKTVDSLLNWREASHAARDREHIQQKCRSLANDFDVTAILPLSSLCLLLDYASNTSTNWMIDFEVNNLPTGSVFQRKCRIAISRPLPRLTMNGLEMHKVAFKYLLRTSMIPRIEKMYSCKEKRETKRMQMNDRISVESQEYRCRTFDNYLAQVYDKYAAFTVPKGNTMYRVWELSDNQSEQNSMRILVTSKQDAYQPTRDGQYNYINYSSKVEFQNEFGAEQMTKSELLREWCRCYFRPNSTTQRVRIDVESQRIVQCKEITLDDIERDLQRLYQIDARTLLENLWCLLRTIQKFPQGEYLFRHEPKHNNQVMVYAKTDDKSGLYLPNIYAAIDFQKSWSETIQWMPIDDTEVTIIHKMGQVMPCAFPHYRGLQSQQKKPKRMVQHNISPRDDRPLILKRIQMEHQIEEEKLQARMDISKKVKKRKRNLRRKKIREMKPAMDMEYIGETLDPYSMFDPAGNVSIAAMVEPGGILFAAGKSEPSPAGVKCTTSSPLKNVYAEKAESEDANKAESSNQASFSNNGQSVERIDCDKMEESPASFQKVDDPRPQSRNESTVKDAIDNSDHSVEQVPIEVPTDHVQPTQPTDTSHLEQYSPDNHNNRKLTPKRSSQKPTASSIQTITRSGRLVKPKFK